MSQVYRPGGKMSNADLAWLAGLLEGEGSFGNWGIEVCSTDRDVLERVSRLWGDRPIWIRSQAKSNIRCQPKTLYRVTLPLRSAIPLLRVLINQMGSRRQLQIKRLLC